MDFINLNSRYLRHAKNIPALKITREKCVMKYLTS